MAEYSREELEAALENAKAAGDEEAVQLLSAELAKMENDPNKSDFARLITGEEREPSAYGKSYLGQGVSGLAEGAISSVDFASKAAQLQPSSLIGAGIRQGAERAGLVEPATERFSVGENLTDLGERTGAIQPRTDDPRKENVRNITEMAGAAAVGGPRAAVYGGLSAAAGEVTKEFTDNPYAELAAELLAVPTVAAAEKLFTNTLLKVGSKSLTSADLRKRAQDLYAKGEKAGITAKPAETQDMADTIRGVLNREGVITPGGKISDKMSDVSHALRMLDDYAGSTMTPKQLHAVRRAIATAARSVDPNEARIGSMMLDSFDIYTSKLHPTLLEANKIYHQVKKAEKIEELVRLAEDRATSLNTGAGLEGAIRVEFRALVRKILKGQEKGWSKEELKALQKISQGTFLKNRMRDLGKFAPNSWGGALGSAVVGGGAGAAAGPGGAGVGMVGLAAAGGIGKATATMLARRDIAAAEKLLLAGVPKAKVAAMSVPEQEAAVKAILAQIAQRTEASAQPQLRRVADNEEPATP